MKRIYGIVNAALKCSMSYKLKLFFYAVQSFMQYFIFYFLWSSAYATRNIISGFSFSEMITYLTVSFFLQSIVPKWVTMEIGWKTKSGNLVTDLLRPISYSKYLLYYSFGDVIFAMLFGGIPVAVMGIASGRFFWSENMLAFGCSVILSYFIAYLMHYIVGLISFWTSSIWGIFIAFNLLSTFCAGGILPIDFMPELLQKIIDYLPFRYLLFEPIMIYLGRSEGIMSVLLAQMVWIVVLKMVSEIMFRRGSRRLEIAGG